MTKDEALKLALEALEVASSCVDGYYIPIGKSHLPEVEQAITAIKEALAQPEQEPVAKVSKRYVNNIDWLNQIPEFDTLLYTTAPQRTWVGLTDGEMQAVVDAQPLVSSINVYLKAIEAKLKEKNT